MILQNEEKLSMSTLFPQSTSKMFWLSFQYLKKKKSVVPKMGSLLKQKTMT